MNQNKRTAFFISILIIAITDHLLVSDAGYLSQFLEQTDQNISVHLNPTLKIDMKIESSNGCYASYRIITWMEHVILII